jgi:hypothetical protein
LTWVPTTQSLNHTQNAAPGQPQESNYMEEDEEVEEEGCAFGSFCDNIEVILQIELASNLAGRRQQGAYIILLLIFLALTRAMQAYDKNHNGRLPQTRQV